MKRFWNSLIRSILTVGVTLGLVTGLTACAPEKVDMTNITAVVDVRTPAEFAEGHLDGAVNIDFESGNFASEIAKLDPTGTYVLYCRSGNRAGKALSQMQTLGFTNVTNAGGLADAAAATGLAIVK